MSTGYSDSGTALTEEADERGAASPKDWDRPHPSVFFSEQHRRVLDLNERIARILR
jgi:hypothetical protein